ncbi:Hypothetical predicted protein, partial [Olea europaea subsp. europaea]
MAAFTIRQLGGRAPLARFGRYSTAQGAARALKRQGFGNLADAVDSLGLVRIPPAAALPADIHGFEAEEGGIALAVHLAQNRVLGFFPHPDGRLIAVAAIALAAAQWVAAAVTTAATAAGLTAAAADLAAGIAGAATIAGVTAGEIWAVGEISSLLTPPPKLNTGGSPIDWKADPQAPVPYVVGRTGTSGNIVLEDVAGDKNKYITYATVLSLGPVKSIGGFKANDVLTRFTSDAGEGAGTGQQTTTLAAAVSSGAT